MRRRSRRGRKPQGRPQQVQGPFGGVFGGSDWRILRDPAPEGRIGSP